MTFDPRLSARVQVPASADLVSIVLAAGGDPAHAVFGDGWLTVRGITQAGLDAAATPADPLYGARVAIKMAAQVELRRRVDAGLPFRGKVADMDEEQSQRRINGAVTGAILAQSQGAPFLVSWRMADNTALDLDAPGLMTLGMMVLGYFQALNARCWSIIDAAMAAPDAAALSALDPLADWPEPPAEPAPPAPTA